MTTTETRIMTPARFLQRLGAMRRLWTAGGPFGSGAAPHHRALRYRMVLGGSVLSVGLLAAAVPAQAGPAGRPSGQLASAELQGSASGYEPIEEVTCSEGSFVVDQHNGDDELGSGAADKPWATIQKAADSLIPGQCVRVEPGDYVGPVTINVEGTPEKPIVFEASTKHGAVILGGVTAEQKDGIVFRGFQVTGAYQAIHFLGPARYLRITDNWTHDNGASGIFVAGVQPSDANPPQESQDPSKCDLDGDGIPNEFACYQDVQISGNIIQGFSDNIQAFPNPGFNERLTVGFGVDEVKILGNEIVGTPEDRCDNGGEGIDIKQGVRHVEIASNDLKGLCKTAIYSDAGRAPWSSTTPRTEEVEIHSNRITGTDRNGIWVGSEGSGNASDIRVFNNIVVGADHHGIMVYRHPGSTGSFQDIAIANNTVWNTGWIGLVMNQPEAHAVRFRNNIAYQACTDQTYANCSAFKLIRAPGDFQASNQLLNRDPRFMDPAHSDFRLQDSSPAIDAGTAADAPIVDIEDIPRPQGREHDIGAHEHPVEP